ncbi:fimbrial protein [Phocaeicola vulgatus]|uniref:fimbrial protein n=1 Tax=Phocaeicola vulgatus TaxID=821 RepID=UPI001E336109|nr:fimbrial protein [Phocaeicola vulgatus]
MMKRKKLFRYYLRYVQFIGWTALLFACSDDSPEQKPDGTMETVRITIQTRANGENILELEENEYKIQTLRMYVFSDDKKLLGYHYVNNTTGEQQTVTFTMKLPTGSHTFYTIANERAAGKIKKNNAEGFTFPEPTNTESTIDLETLGRQISPDILKSLTFSELPAATYSSGGNTDSKDETNKKYTSPLLPMVSEYTRQVTPNGSVSISLTRSVAKMQLYFTTTGAGECYMGRGLYLYNEPKYGYLFPCNTYSDPIGRKEAESAPSDWNTNPDYQDSHLHQLNGRVILNSGWPDEPESYGDTEHTEQMEGLDINLIEADINDPTNPQYEQLPQKSFYLFANPNISTGQLREDVVVSATKPVGDGYYLKILVHQHGADHTGVELHKGERFYLPLPAVKANDCLSIYSVVTLDGHVTLTPHWMIQEWQEGGGSIEFN